MEMISKKTMMMAVLAFGFVLQASAQVPSIPRKANTTTTQARKAGNVVWGTEYDFLSTRYISYNDIKDYDSGQIRVLKNSIYARHGRIFKDAALREYFSEQSWYRGTRKEIPESEFNKFEKANIAFLLKYE